MHDTTTALPTDLLTLAVLPDEHPVEQQLATMPHTSPARELARRAGDGLTIVLLWRPGDENVTLSVADARTGERFELTVDGAKAMDAFHHPFAYAP